MVYDFFKSLTSIYYRYSWKIFIFVFIFWSCLDFCQYYNFAPIWSFGCIRY